MGTRGSLMQRSFLKGTVAPVHQWGMQRTTPSSEKEFAGATDTSGALKLSLGENAEDEVLS